jgi:UDP:flavonoid glycosyltransferase YjiC (YdhE family)
VVPGAHGQPERLATGSTLLGSVAVRVLAACSLGGAGHLHPLLPFLAAARRRGDETLVAGPPALSDLVERAGYAFQAGGEPPEADVAPIRERLPVVSPREASVLGNRDLFGRLATTAMLPGMRQICAEWSPHFVLREPCEYASAIVAHETGIPNAQVAISLARGEAASIAAAAPALEEHGVGLVRELRASPYLTRFPASLDPPSFRTTIRFRVHGAVDGHASQDWWDGSDAPLVYTTFGTVLGHMSIAADVYRMALKAVTDLDVRVLLTVGHRFDRSDLGPIPANTHVEAWLEQANVLNDADLVVCHGGSGTVLGALAAGVPVMVLPIFADQFENGRRVAECGAGLVIEPEQGHADGRRRVLGEADAPRIAHAIEAVLGATSYRRNARRIAIEMGAAPTVDDVLEAVLAGRVDRIR